MSTDIIESLLEQLITTNENILSELVEVKQDISEIREELNWVGEHAFAKVIYERVDASYDKLIEIEALLANIDVNTSD